MKLDGKAAVVTGAAQRVAARQIWPGLVRTPLSGQPIGVRHGWNMG